MPIQLYVSIKESVGGQQLHLSHTHTNNCTVIAGEWERQVQRKTDRERERERERGGVTKVNVYFGENPEYQIPKPISCYNPNRAYKNDRTRQVPCSKAHKQLL